MPNIQQSYPRPDFQRLDLTWASLDGPWDFVFDDTNIGLSQLWHQSGLPTELEHYTIEVPFVFQTPASGLNNQDAHEVLWYERMITDIRTEQHVARGYRLLLHFGAVDYEATIWVNGHEVGSHRGGHVPFHVDVTDAIKAQSNDTRLTVRVRDSPHDLTQPRGKQYWKPQPESIFYTPSSGIWQSVWLESVPPVRIADSSLGTVIRSNDIDTGQLHTEISVLGHHEEVSLIIEVTAGFRGLEIGRVHQKLSYGTKSITIMLPMWLVGNQYKLINGNTASSSNPLAWKREDERYLALWSPEYPHLYDLAIRLLTSSNEVLDTVHTTTGMRSLTWSHSDNTFRLNGQPYFQALVLDQGYWPRTNITPPRPEALKADIELSKAMGFNGCRKHQKVEDPLFLYWADRLGYLVWGEMANAYEFSATYVERFDAEWQEAVRRDINHPCIVTWTPINESWGYNDLRGNKDQQDHLRRLHEMTKAIDTTRPVNDNCGWEHVSTDLTTFHDYSDAPELKEICGTLDGILNDKAGKCVFVGSTTEGVANGHSPNAPIICTEFGGVNIAPAEGEKAGDRDWGYTTASDPEDLLKRVEALVMAVVEGGLCCGFVYTQLTDIEQEVNGLYSFDRKPKLDVQRVKAIMDRAKTRYVELLELRKT